MLHWMWITLITNATIQQLQMQLVFEDMEHAALLEGQGYFKLISSLHLSLTNIASGLFFQKLQHCR